MKVLTKKLSRATRTWERKREIISLGPAPSARSESCSNIPNNAQLDQTRRGSAQATLLRQLLHSLTANFKDAGLMLGGFMKSSLIYDILSSWDTKPGEVADQGRRVNMEKLVPDVTHLPPCCSKSKGNNDSRSIKAPKRSVSPQKCPEQRKLPCLLLIAIIFPEFFISLLCLSLFWLRKAAPNVTHFGPQALLPEHFQLLKIIVTLTVPAFPI